ncbi:hypothetical protein QR680_005868 [Steinernema hermaphroditum]|uniref:Sphingomyelin synthase-like domain-containing protein n=1 Tax=Steinernema hermaphroditum TaxID=289476 RepID=A0AA39HTK5_9BILA|nr:hypothetical protein QR680_005868 [Steinernema hermaphroditum]
MDDSSSDGHIQKENRAENFPVAVNESSDGGITTKNLSNSLVDISGRSTFLRKSMYPSEKMKCFVVFGVFMIALLANCVVLAHSNDVVGRTALSDLTFIFVPQQDWAEPIGDGLVGSAVIIAVSFLAIFHKHRTIVLKRFFYTLSILYLMRAVCISLTHYPSTFVNSFKKCVEPSHDGLSDIFWRVVHTVKTLGSLVKYKDNRVLCGDLLFSGHTTAVTQSTFYLNYYTPKFLWPLRWILIVMCVAGMICLTISRTHYSVDVVVAYWVSSMIFSLYHAFCNAPHSARPQNRAFRRLILFWTMFELERDVPAGRLPNRLEWPFSRPQFMVRFVKQLDSPEEDNILGRTVLFFSRHRMKTHF